MFFKIVGQHFTILGDHGLLAPLLAPPVANLRKPSPICLEFVIYIDNSAANLLKMGVNFCENVSDDFGIFSSPN